MRHVDRSPISEARKRIVQDPGHPNIELTRYQVEHILTQLNHLDHLSRFATAGVAQDKDSNFRLNPGIMPYDVTNDITKPLEVNNIIPALTVYFLEIGIKDRGYVLKIQCRSDLPNPWSMPSFPILRRNKFIK